MRLLGIALIGARFIGDCSLEEDFVKEVELSLLPGLIVILSAEAGREGGPIGLVGPKKLDRLRSVAGVGGKRDILSTVLSDRLGRDDFRAFGVVWELSTRASETSRIGLSARKLCRDEARKPSKEPS